MGSTGYVYGDHHGNTELTHSAEEGEHETGTYPARGEGKEYVVEGLRSIRPIHPRAASLKFGSTASK